MGQIVVWISNHPKRAIVSILLGIALLLPQLGNLRLSADMEQFLPESDPATDYYRNEFINTFGSDVLSVVVVKPVSGDVFTRKTLTVIQTLTEAFEELDGVDKVASLTTVHMIRGEKDYLNTEQLIPQIPTAPEALARIRKNALRQEEFHGYIVDREGQTAAINIYTRKPPDDIAFEARFVRSVEAIIARHQGDAVLYHVGTPLANTTFLASIRKDQTTINMAAVVVITLFLFFTYRSFLAVLLPLLTTSLSVAATFGFLAWMNYPITPYTALVPGLILVIGSTEDMHMLSLYFHKLRAGTGKDPALLAMARKSALPITITAFTTIVGFGTLGFNETTIIRQFGITMAFGLGANYLVTITTLPALLRWVKAPAIATSGGDGRSTRALSLLLDHVCRVTRHQPGVVLVIAGLMVMLACIGIPRVSVNNDYLGFFKENTHFKQNLRRLGQDLAGINTLNIVLETTEGGDILLPEVLEKIDGLQRFIHTLGLFEKTLSIADHVKRMHSEFHNGDEKRFHIPASRAATAQYLLLMDVDTVEEFIDTGRKRARIRIIHQISGSEQLVIAVDRIERYMEKNTASYVKDGGIRDITATVTGLDYLIKNSGDTIVRSQTTSLGLALGIIFILMTIVFMSVKGGVIAIVSNIIPILIHFGIMGWFDIALDTSTCMVSLIALGIAVDDTIHFMIRYQQESRNVENPQQAIARTLRAEGEPVVFTSLALALGFATLMLSDFVPSIHFGFLSALVMLYALLTDLFVNPVVLVAAQLITIWDYLALRFKKTILESSLVFQNLRHSDAKKVVLLGSIQRAARGDRVCRQGSPGEEMYLILSGRARVVVDAADGSEKALGSIERGELFGEMALLGEGTRSATVIAETGIELLRIDYHALERVQRRNPRIAAQLFLNIARILGERVRSQNLGIANK